MSLFAKLFKKNQAAVDKEQAALVEDLEKAAFWAADNLEGSGYLADYSLESLKDLDRFFDEERQGLLAEHEDKGIILFTLGAYFGQVAIKTYGGQWEADDQDPQVELHVAVRLTTGQRFLPVQACIRRYKRADSQSLSQFLAGLVHEAGHQKRQEEAGEQALEQALDLD